MPKKLPERPAPTPTDVAPLRPEATSKAPRAAKTAPRAVSVDSQAAGADPRSPVQNQRVQTPPAAPQSVKTATPVAKPTKTSPTISPAPSTQPTPASRKPKKSAAQTALNQPALTDLPATVQNVPEAVKSGRAGKAAPKKSAPTPADAAPARQPSVSKPRRAAKFVVEPEPVQPEPAQPEPVQPEPVQVAPSANAGAREAAALRTARNGKAAPKANPVRTPAAKPSAARIQTLQTPAADSPAAENTVTGPVAAEAPLKAASRNRRKAQTAPVADIQPVNTQPEPVQLHETAAPEVQAAPRQGRRKSAAPAVKASVPETAQDGSPAAEAPPARRPSRRGRPAVTQAPAEPLLMTAPSGSDDDAEQASGAAVAAQTDPSSAPQARTRAPRPKRGQKGKEEAPAQGDVEPLGDEAPAPRAVGHEVSPEARDLIIAQLRKLGRPVHVRDFERTFTRQGREKLGVRRDLAGLLEDLALSGDVIRTRRHTYGLPEAMNLVRGRFQASSGGFGFVIPDSGGDDFYIREGETLEAWNGDIVLIRPEGQSGGNDRYGERAGSRGGNRRSDSPRAAVVRIVTRAYSQLVGSLDHQKTYAFLKPDDYRARHRIMLQPDGTEGLPNGARVVAQLYWPEHTGEDEVYGEIVRVLGNEDDPATETQAVIVKYGLRDEFPDDVVREAEAVPRRFPDSALKGRLDLRDYNIFTVDGSDAKDFDDAIHIQATPEGTFVVGIHIADVSHYVTPGTALDAEAYARATSVYLPGAVLPMLPEHLSNGVCSLVPDEDRLTMSAMLELSGDGEVLSSAFTPSVIRSKARLTYDEVQAYSEAVATLQGNARALEGDLHLLLKITAKLRQKRLREGSLDFKMREVKVDVGKDGHMQLIPLREETARGMIEDLMLLANKAVAHYLLEKNVPTLYRIHEEPTLARFHDVTGAIGRMGLAFPGGEPTPQAYQAVLKSVRGTPQESAVNTLLLRSMQQAKYAEENLGHFGLAFDEYLHFTSPIRRYPDLLVHRALRAALEGPVSDRLRGDLASPLAEQGRHTSERERTAAEAERDLTKYYQAKWAQEHIGESFEGRVSGVIASGLFVALENGVEGRLHISNLDDDYYFYIEDASILKGRTSGRIYRIGENIQVTVSTVNPLARQIDFTQENTMDGNDNRPRARRREDRESQKREKLSSFLPPRPGEAAATADADVADTADTADADTAPAAQGQQQQLQRRDGPSGGNPAGGRREARPEREGARPTEPRSSEPRSGEPRSGDRARQGAAGNAQRPGGGNSGGGFRRRVVTLDRPRNEHLRPVNVTVQRMYFGDWTIENMPPDEGQGGGSGGQRSGGGTFRGRSGGQSGGQSSGGARSSGPRTGGDQNRRPQQARDGAQREAQPARDQAQPGNTAAGAAADEARRRRRRRGRRGGNGQSGQG
jgi:ribonuclease R